MGKEFAFLNHKLLKKLLLKNCIIYNENNQILLNVTLTLFTELHKQLKKYENKQSTEYTHL